MSCWSHINVELINDYETTIYDHNFFLEDFREKKIEIGTFRKMAKFFFYQRYQLDFLHIG